MQRVFEQPLPDNHLVVVKTVHLHEHLGQEGDGGNPFGACGDQGFDGLVIADNLPPGWFGTVNTLISNEKLMFVRRQQVANAVLVQVLELGNQCVLNHYNSGGLEVGRVDPGRPVLGPNCAISMAQSVTIWAPVSEAWEDH